MERTPKDLLIHESHAREFLISYCIKYFSVKEKRTADAIMKDFLPYLMNFSGKFMGGLVMDTTIFKETLDLNQLDFLKEVFVQAKAVKAHTSIIKDSEIFRWLINFKHLDELEISVNGDDTFLFPEELFKFESVNILCRNRTIWLDPVHQILSKNQNSLSSLKLQFVYLSPSTMNIMTRNQLSRLSLYDVIIYSLEDRTALMDFIINHYTLRRLELIYITKGPLINHFMSFSSEFFKRIKNQILNIVSLTVTLDQTEHMTQFNLVSLADLSELIIYYTVEKEFKNIQNIIHEILSLERSGLLTVPRLKFIEYFTHKDSLSVLNEVVISQLSYKSTEYAGRIRANGKR